MLGRLWPLLDWRRAAVLENRHRRLRQLDIYQLGRIELTPERLRVINGEDS